ncbi:hypothetical protein [Tepidiforma sp.]|uniref:hypothetical protein n=1 Tax=Tepidiforma sp. TaxID=2682230 RepID=UPI0026294E3B|nr:hypothetical protein [Tepidiforma sp.]MCX7618932.1 hypothetical protein [Tepidiforma sp.]
MGFELRRTVTLTFEGAYEGLEVRCSAVIPVGEALRITRMLADAGDERFEEVFRAWFDAVQPTWNAELDGLPIECTADAMLAYLPADIMVNIIPMWRQAATGVDPTSRSASPSGEPLPASPIPALANLSTALAS